MVWNSSGPKGELLEVSEFGVTQKSRTKNGLGWLMAVKTRWSGSFGRIPVMDQQILSKPGLESQRVSMNGSQTLVLTEEADL